MPTFSPAPQDVKDLALAILSEHPGHQPLLDAKVKIDFVFAFADVDKKTGQPINNAITARGFRVLGQTKKMALKDRAMGRGDAEILIDADHWNEAGDAQRKAMLDHELNHIEVRIDERGILTDDLDRPLLRLRKHDIETGWFNVIAARHGAHSIERIQAQQILDAFGQFYFPALCGKTEGTATVRQPVRRFGQIARDIAE